MRFFGRKSGRALSFGDVAPEDDRGIEVRRLSDESREHFWGEARLLFRDLVFALMIMALVLVFVAQPVKVEGTSMLPRLHDGERIFVNKLIYYGLPDIERGDIVVFWFPDDPSKSYIKRVIGLPGETVQMRAGRIFVNGKELKEPYLDPSLNAAPEVSRRPTCAHTTTSSWATTATTLPTRAPGVSSRRSTSTARRSSATGPSRRPASYATRPNTPAFLHTDSNRWKTVKSKQ
jgi:signal peptidase I